MEPTTGLGSGMVLIFFINGLAFFAMGLAIRMETRSSSKLKLAESLWLLAGFALLRSVANWAEMFLHIQGQAGPDHDFSPLHVAETLLLILSAMFLLQFGVSLFTSATQRHRWVRWVPAGLVSLWLLVIAGSQYGRADVGWEWLVAAEVWGRVLLYLPGAALSGFAVFLHCRYIREMELPHLSRSCDMVVVAFGLKAVLAGLVVPYAPFFPASVLNEAAFLAAVGRRDHQVLNGPPSRTGL